MGDFYLLDDLEGKWKGHNIDDSGRLKLPADYLSDYQARLFAYLFTEEKLIIEPFEGSFRVSIEDQVIGSIVTNPDLETRTEILKSADITGLNNRFKLVKDSEDKYRLYGLVDWILEERKEGLTVLENVNLKKNNLIFNKRQILHFGDVSSFNYVGRGNYLELIPIE